jgi:catechol 2,3-dioxygenase-like lactoylglutathione lyase family enzyme
MSRLTGIRRGVKDPGPTASWIGWLLDLEARKEEDRFRFECSNGWLVIDGDFKVPVGLDLAETGACCGEPDPDGVPVHATGRAGVGRPEVAVSLDHVRLNCADLAGTAEFYRRLGFTLTWAGRGDDELDGPQEAPLDGADWLHLSGTDGYVSVSQADWQDHGTASGPPRFIHIGLAVARLEDVTERLDGAGTHYLRGHPAVGRNLYVNDPSGEPLLGTNVEIIEYKPGVSRSGKPTPG